MTHVVFDTTALSHFARAGRLETLRSLTAGWTCCVTRAVLDELDWGSRDHPELERASFESWLRPVAIDGLEELAVFAEYTRRLGSIRGRDIGEATVLAWAKLNDAVALVDEQTGRDLGRERGVEVHGMLWLIANGIRSGAVVPRKRCRRTGALRRRPLGARCSRLTSSAGQDAEHL